MEKSVLVIYTGGTIGMVNDPATGVLCPFNFDQISLEVPEIREFDFNIDNYTLPELIDSSDLRPALWVDLCRIILDNRARYHGFVILHGTDTMAYSASALSFMLEHLDKPVIFTGSQLPIGKIRTDGKENLLAAIEIAAASDNGKPLVPEVCILFGDRLFRGNRATKINAESFDAFQSFNYPPLAEIGIHVHYNRAAILPPPLLPPVARAGLDTRVAILKIFPGLGADIVAAILSVPGLRGVILETYGSGNAPTRADFLDAIRAAVARGIFIYNVTQCAGGSVETGRYATGRGLHEAGVINGRDITTEAALCKMMHVLGRGLPPDDTRRLLDSNLRGEISIAK